MKFLVITKPKKGVSTPENYADLLRAATTWITSKIETGEIESLYAILPNGSTAVVNSESHEKLWGDMISYPLYPLLKWTIKPIVDWKFTFDKSIEMLSK